MFRKVMQGFTNAATKPGCLGPFQRSLPQQESALPNAYESNDRNVTGLSYKKNTTKIQQPETFSTQCIGVSEFLLGRIPASGSSKPSLGGDVQFKKLRDIARLNPALHHSESQPVGFGANQQAVKNILAEREKSDILSGTWGLMQNPINNSFREGEMTKENEQGASESQQLETLKSENEKLKGQNQQLEELKSENEELKTKLQGSENKNKELKEELDRKTSEVSTLTEEKGQLEKKLDSVKQSLNEKDKELKNTKSQLEKLKQDLNEKTEEFKDKQAQLTEKEGEVSKLNDQVAQLTGEKNQLKEEFDGIKAQLASKEEKISELNGQVTKLTEEKNQLDKDLNSTKQSLDAKDEELENKNKELESKAQELEALKSENESQVKDLQKQLESKNKELEDNKPSAVNAQGVKSKVNYTSAFFVLSGVCAVGASLATPYLAICAILAVAASVFLALGFHCLYKANTALSDVKVQQNISDCLKVVL